MATPFYTAKQHLITLNLISRGGGTSPCPPLPPVMALLSSIQYSLLRVENGVRQYGYCIVEYYKIQFNLQSFKKFVMFACIAFKGDLNNKFN